MAFTDAECCVFVHTGQSYLERPFSKCSAGSFDLANVWILRHQRAQAVTNREDSPSQNSRPAPGLQEWNRTWRVLMTKEPKGGRKGGRKEGRLIFNALAINLYAVKYRQ